jgi:fructokinase
MKHLVTMGELLIDFIPLEKGRKLKEVTGFTKYPGGAPANVAVAGVKSGISSYFIGQVGKDAFGDYLVDCLKNEGVSCDYLYQSSLANTALAYVTLSDAGERDFIFYRDPSADQLLHADQVEESILKDCVFHFCSVSLCDYPIRDAHIKAIDSARLQGGFISFDPNLRLSLWKDHNAYKDVIQSFIPKADLLKISNDELSFITGISDETSAIKSLFVGHVKYIIITRGSLGSTFFFKSGNHIDVPAFKVQVVDTTGAGDAFIGTFLAEMIKRNLDFSTSHVEDALMIANAKAALTTTKFGGMSSIPNNDEYQRFIHQNNTKKDQ